MIQRDSFAHSHPLVNALYYVAVVGIATFCLHPVILIMSYLAAMTYAASLRGWRHVLRLNLTFVIPGMLIVAVLNPTFNHYGVTPLVVLNDGNSITVEAIVYGVILALSLAVVINWFVSINLVMTRDKFVYLFGRILPVGSLVLAMVFRFVPLFQRQFRTIRHGQQSLGRAPRQVRLWRRPHAWVTIWSIMLTWALENAITTADSMKARGYGQHRRTSFAIYRMRTREWLLVGLILLLTVLLVVSISTHQLMAQYNPTIMVTGFASAHLTPLSMLGLVAATVLVWLPLILRLFAAWRWRKVGHAGTAHATLPDYFRVPTTDSQRKYHTTQEGARL
ncbi:energy-coupling factor transporter transmembrane component T [uncultured Lacticaseibacillus sp.]|uniref:energy-coupling factor transporter transmembrane component T n=1 Tax=uncultured Lacticaseibacillus sp. TaxID=2775882 RepID=UPI0025932E98|nr:energy-coupling factor transporter transmembrane component T [uncultured Lacticaseibacillus sp.]